MAFEGLNNLGHAGSDVTIVLNDNGRSYAPTVSRLSESLVKIRNNPIYMRRQAKMEEIAERIPWSASRSAVACACRKRRCARCGSRRRSSRISASATWAPSTVTTSPRWKRPSRTPPSSTGLSSSMCSPRRAGFAPAEQDEIKAMHDAKPGLADNGGAAKTGSYTAAFSETLVKLGDQHPELVAITAAMPDSTGLLPSATDSPTDASMSASPSSTPSRRQPAWQWAASARSSPSTRPLTRAIDQVNLDVGLHGLPVIFCLDRAGITGPDGASHHGVLISCSSRRSRA